MKIKDKLQDGSIIVFAERFCCVEFSHWPSDSTTLLLNPLSSSGEKVALLSVRCGIESGFSLSSRLQMSPERRNRGLLLHLCWKYLDATSKWRSCTPEWLPQKISTGYISSVVLEIGGEVVLADTCLTCCRRRRKGES